MPARTKPRSTDAVLHELRAFGLAYPGAHTKSPWPGHLDLAVKDKTFAYLSIEGDPFSISCKLPHTSSLALMLPFATPTGYGLGKSGWVSAKLADGDPLPIDMFKAWIDESYRAQAPKKLVAVLPPTRPLAASAKAVEAPAPAPKKASARARKPVPAPRPPPAATTGTTRSATRAKPTAGAKRTTAASKRPR